MRFSCPRLILALSRFTGDISLEFASGLTVRVPNSEYVRPDVTIDKNTGALQVNDTEPDVAMISLQGSNSNDVIKIGRNFFSAAYIMVNYDAGEFTIWPANQTASQDLVAVDGKGTELDGSCSSNENATVTAGGATPSDTDTISTGTSTAESSDSSYNQSTPVGAIAGGVVGGAVGIAALVLVACLTLRRRKAKRHTPLAELDHDSAMDSSTPMSRLQSPKPETPAARSEFSGSVFSRSVHELAPQSLSELPHTKRGQRHEVWSAGAAPPRYELPGHAVVHEM